MSVLGPTMNSVARATLLFMITLAQPALASVGFQTAEVASTTGEHFAVAIWYPSEASATKERLGLFMQTVATNAPVHGAGLPLIVVSHGHGGTKEEHYDTALALANAGFVVAALDHVGDTYRDKSHGSDVARRPRDLHRLVDYMLSEWPGHAALDPGRVGAFGYSAGGLSVLIAAGGEPDLSLIPPHCVAHPDYFDCQLLTAHPIPPEGGPPFVHDARIRAVVSAAPALGFTLARGLAAVTQPVQLWRADKDQVLPAPEYADAVREALPRPPEFHPVPNADHYAFLAPCSAALEALFAEICRDPPGFDRAAFHDGFDAAVVQFFQANLPESAARGP